MVLISHLLGEILSTADTIVATACLYFLVQLSYVTVMEPGQGGDGDFD